MSSKTCKLGFTETTSEVDGDYAIVLIRLDLKGKDLI